MAFLKQKPTKSAADLEKARKALEAAKAPADEVKIKPVPAADAEQPTEVHATPNGRLLEICQRAADFVDPKNKVVQTLQLMSIPSGAPRNVFMQAVHAPTADKPQRYLIGLVTMHDTPSPVALGDVEEYWSEKKYLAEWQDWIATFAPETK